MDAIEREPAPVDVDEVREQGEVGQTAENQNDVDAAVAAGEVVQPDLHELDDSEDLDDLDDDHVPTDAELAGTTDKEPDPPVYDERGNVRPRGTKGARPMSYAERVAIAERIQDEAAGSGTAPEPTE